jgi:hypothetical protein
MSNPFFDHPILNSPYAYPRRHWELDEVDSLPSDLMLADTNESESKKATENVARAADELNKAVTALNGDTKAGNRDQSIKAIKQALAQIQQERMKISANAATTGSASYSSGSK